MAKRAKKAPKAKKASTPKHYVAHPSYHSAKYDCYGKMVRTKKGGAKNSARVYCGKQA